MARISQPDEAGTSFANAQLIDLSYTGYMNSSDDVDYFRLNIAPGTTQISILPDLAEFIYDQQFAGLYPVGVPLLAAETGLSVSLYEKVIYEGEISYRTYGNVQHKDDTLALSGRTPLSEVKFYDVQSFFAAPRDELGTYYTGEYYLKVSGGPLFHQFLSANEEDNYSPYAGRYLITSGNPTGQRSAAWGSGWIDRYNATGQQVEGQPDDSQVINPDPGGSIPDDVKWNHSTSGSIESPEYEFYSDGSYSVNKHGDLPIDTPHYRGRNSTDFAEHVEDVTGQSVKDLIKEFIIDVFTPKSWEEANEKRKILEESYTEKFFKKLITEAVDLFNSFGSGGDDRQLQERLRGFEERTNERLREFGEDTREIFGVPVINPLSYWFQETNSFKLNISRADQPASGSYLRDLYIGSDRGDRFISTGTGDVVSMFGGDDIITTEHALNNHFSGGSGLDTVAYSGRRSNYTIVTDGDTTTVTDISFTRMSDWLSGVERIKFSDGTLALDIEGNAGQAYRLYQAAFERKPDIEGLSYWIKEMDKGVSLKAVADSFINSPEFTTTYGTPQTVSNAQYVELLYTHTLGRNYDQEGYNYWVNRLDTNATNRADLLAFFSESDENQARVAGAVSDGIWYS